MKGTLKLQTDPWAIVAVAMMLKIDPQILDKKKVKAVIDENGNHERIHPINLNENENHKLFGNFPFRIVLIHIVIFHLNASPE